jgi:hypothetical protein
MKVYDQLAEIESRSATSYRPDGSKIVIRQRQHQQP